MKLALNKIASIDIDSNTYGIFLKDQKVLVLRESGRKLFGLPGGGLKSGEESLTGLIRELKEELKINILKKDVQLLKIFWGPAGRKKLLKAECFIIKTYDQGLKSGKEIEEMAWIDDTTSKNYNLNWITKNQVLPCLISQKLIS